ncbi:ATPase, F0 complex, subunit J [Cordyceps militaris CM01]|uniref:ATPase, F0 complex, subunit J n=1 Tax=Cordyceps militaris (strain CM01) TaxID=983644 RepID=G3JF66_CORMM|nr:ATPase, F0 complex, subunit J [Cordyceps militaris CM01]EGX93506.1 ATPase, F0 complex, subunit J [Cordyceps militaris CM01]
MSWLGVAPLKKFPAPFPLLAFLRCRYVMRKCDPEIDSNFHRNLAIQWRKYEIRMRLGNSAASSKREMLTRLAGAVIAYGANSAQNAMMASDEWKNDPRNPNAKTAGGH